MLSSPMTAIEPYVNLARRRKWWIIITFLFSAVVGVVLLEVLPKTYRASTVILLEPQSIPDSFVRSTVTEGMEVRLRTINQQIMRRANLVRLIEQFQLDRKQPESELLRTLKKVTSFVMPLGRQEDAKQQSLTNEEASRVTLLGEIRENLEVSMIRGSAGSGRGQPTGMAFVISFGWSDAEIVAPVTNAITSRFIEENLDIREERAASTTDFLDQESTTLRRELETHEKALEAFKVQNMGMLPDQLGSNVALMNQLREEKLNLERRLEQEKQQSLLLRSQAQMASADRTAMTTTFRQELSRSAGSRHQPGTRQPQQTTEQLTSGTLEDLEMELRRLSSQYTEKHPDVVAIKRRIEIMRQEGRGAEPGLGAPSSDSSSSRIAPQLALINANVASYEREIREVEKQIQTYKDRVEKTPQVEMELNKILRDYQTVRQRYDSLLQKKMDAQMAEQVEKHKKGEQFKVLDPAVKPVKPFKPDPLRVMAISLAAGLGLGFGLAYLREALDPRFYNPEELEAYLGAKVMVSLPTVKSEQ